MKATHVILIVWKDDLKKKTSDKCFNQIIILMKYHTTYTSRNNMGQKCEGNCGLWVLNEIIKKIYPENLKKNVGAVWE